MVTKPEAQELVEGPTLADRIAKGAIPVDEALPIAKLAAVAGRVQLWDLRLIRAQLNEMGLDWDLPSPSSSGGQTSAPLRVDVQLGVASPRFEKVTSKYRQTLVGYTRALQVERRV